jgi:hypothetical protein
VHSRFAAGRFLARITLFSRASTKPASFICSRGNLSQLRWSRERHTRIAFPANSR